jgi:hypothetical protein
MGEKIMSCKVASHSYPAFDLWLAYLRLMMIIAWQQYADG